MQDAPAAKSAPSAEDLRIVTLASTSVQVLWYRCEVPIAYPAYHLDENPKPRTRWYYLPVWFPVSEMTIFWGWLWRFFAGIIGARRSTSESRLFVYFYSRFRASQVFYYSPFRGGVSVWVTGWVGGCVCAWLRVSVWGGWKIHDIEARDSAGAGKRWLWVWKKLGQLHFRLDTTGVSCLLVVCNSCTQTTCGFRSFLFLPSAFLWAYENGFLPARREHGMCVPSPFFRQGSSMSPPLCASTEEGVKKSHMSYSACSPSFYVIEQAPGVLKPVTCHKGGAFAKEGW